jgi:DNA-binding transcriptional MerR regulator
MNKERIGIQHMGNKDFNKGVLSIKEFAELVGMSISALRHYDNIGAFPPAKHGIAHENNYRYYSPTQITTVKMIRILNEIGIPLDTIIKLTKNRTPERMIKLLSRNRERVADEIRFLQEAFSVINTFLDLLYEGISVTETELIVRDMPEKRIIMSEPNDFSDSNSFFKEYTRFCVSPRESKLNLYYPIGGYFESMGVFADMPSQPTRFFSLDPSGCDKRNAGLYLNGYTRGYYGQANDLPERMTVFAKKNGLVFSGPVYLTYLFDEISMTNTEQYLLQVSASVTETKRLASRRPRHHL